MPAAGHSNILIFATPEEVALNAARRVVAHARGSIENHGIFSVALAGGSTPRRCYELLATAEFASQIEWQKVHLFFGDERTVPHDHPDSNYRLAYDSLISKVPIPANNVHPMNGVGDAVENARDYEHELRDFFKGSEWPRFDLVMLGMGDDGHTASLFPQSEALGEEHAWVVANWVEKFGTYRITLTFSAINAAHAVEFLVTGRGKAPALAAVINEPLDTKRLPSQGIHPTSGSLSWLVDAAAASELEVTDSRSDG